MQELVEGRTGTLPDGTRVVVRGGQVVPLTGPEAAGFEALGGGWYRGPDGGTYQEGRGGAMVKRSEATEAPNPDGTGGGSPRLTEDQGKSQTYTRLMADAEESYQQALRDGFNPTGFTAGAANFIEGVPMLSGLGNFIRDDAGDRARQAELQWTDAQLKAMSGAASPEPEVVRNQITNFARPGQNFADIRAQLDDARLTAFEAARLRAGPGATGVEYPELNGPAPADAITADATRAGLGGMGGVAGAAQGGLAPGSYEPTDQLRGLDKDGNGQVSVEELEAAGFSFNNGQWTLGAPTDGGPGAPPSGPAAPSGPEDSQPIPDFGSLSRGQQYTLAKAVNPIARIGAFDRSALEQAPFAKEAIAGISSLFNGRSYQENRDIQQFMADYDRQYNPNERRIGGVAGFTAGAVVPFGAPVRAVRGGGVIANATNRAIGGAAAGSLYTAGQAEGNALERLDDAAIGAGGGAVAGVAAPAVGNALGRYVVRPVVEGAQSTSRGIARGGVNVLDSMGAGNVVPNALREQIAPRPLESGMRRFADRSPQQVNALNANSARYQAEEIQPTFADVVNDGGRGTLRALATRQTPAREAAREFADGRAAGLQDRVSTQARRTISDDPRSPLEMRTEITTRRNAEADQNFGAVRGEMVSPDPEIVQALRAPALRPAIEEAATSALNRGDSETANMLRQLTDGALDNPNGVQMTVGMADRISRSLNGRAEAFQRSGNNDAAASYFALAERLRGGARTQVPGYDDALQAYSADSGLAKATELGEQFMSMEADQFAAAVARLSPEEQQIARAAARRAVERQAGTQGQAPGVAQRLAGGREQGARSTALIGDAAPMQRAMGTELQALRNAQAVNPGQGSQTSMNLQDAGNAAGGIMGAVTSPVRTIVGAIGNRIRSRGFNDQEAEAIVTAAIDPARTNELVNMLAERMSRREARNLARAIRYQATTSLPSDRAQ